MVAFAAQRAGLVQQASDPPGQRVDLHPPWVQRCFGERIPHRAEPGPIAQLDTGQWQRLQLHCAGGTDLNLLGVLDDVDLGRDGQQGVTDTGPLRHAPAQRRKPPHELDTVPIRRNSRGRLEQLPVKSLRDELREPRPLRQSHHRHQPGVRHQSLIVERRGRCDRLW